MHAAKVGEAIRMILILMQLIPYCFAIPKRESRQASLTLKDVCYIVMLFGLLGSN